MSRFRAITGRWAAVILAAMVVPACSHGSGPDLLSGKAADVKVREVIDSFNQILPAGAAMGDRGDQSSVPTPYPQALRDAGSKARELAMTVKPEEAYEARLALETLSREFARKRGGIVDGAGRVTVGPVVVVPADPEYSRTVRRITLDNSDVRTRQRAVLDTLESRFFHLALVALLLDPDARAAFAPRMAPRDLPGELPTDPTLGNQVDSGLRNRITSVDEWRSVLFDSDGRLKLPELADPKHYGALHAWARSVNPRLEEAVSTLGRRFRDGASR